MAGVLDGGDGQMMETSGQQACRAIAIRSDPSSSHAHVDKQGLKPLLEEQEESDPSSTLRRLNAGKREGRRDGVRIACYFEMNPKEVRTHVHRKGNSLGSPIEEGTRQERLLRNPGGVLGSADRRHVKQSPR